MRKRFVSLAVPLLAAMAMLVGCTGMQTQPGMVSNGQIQEASAAQPMLAPAALPAPAVVLPQFDSSAVFEWKHFGTDPFAHDRATAMGKRAEAFKALGVPDECIAPAMQATDAPGTLEHLNVGDRLVAMLSGGLKVHRNTVVAFPNPPVKKNGIEYAAAVETWTFDCLGTQIKLGLPEVCNNWSLYPPPSTFVPALGSCPEVNILKISVWPDAVFDLFPGLMADVNAEEETTRFLGHKRVSADYGKAFHDAFKAGKLMRDPRERKFDVWMIKTPEAHGSPDPRITDYKYFGRQTMPPRMGLLALAFRKADTDYWDAIRIVPVERDYAYTPIFEQTGVSELRFFNHLPDADHPHGEWDNNPVADCTMNVGFIATKGDLLIPMW